MTVLQLMKHLIYIRAYVDTFVRMYVQLNICFEMIQYNYVHTYVLYIATHAYCMMQLHTLCMCMCN